MFVRKVSACNYRWAKLSASPLNISVWSQMYGRSSHLARISQNSCLPNMMFSTRGGSGGNSSGYSSTENESRMKDKIRLRLNQA